MNETGTLYNSYTEFQDLIRKQFDLQNVSGNSVFLNLYLRM